MNRYIVPICDIQAGEVWNEIISATSLQNCKEKLVEHIVESYNDMQLDDTLPYNKFLEELDKNDILIGKIKDIEEL